MRFAIFGVEVTIRRLPPRRVLTRQYELRAGDRVLATEYTPGLGLTRIEVER